MSSFPSPCVVLVSNVMTSVISVKPSLDFLVTSVGHLFYTLGMYPTLMSVSIYYNVGFQTILLYKDSTTIYLFFTKVSTST